MNELMLFQKEEFGQVRVVEHNGEPWFIAKDVCECLGLDTSNLSKVLDEDELSTCPVQYTDQVPSKPPTRRITYPAQRASASDLLNHLRGG